MVSILTIVFVVFVAVGWALRPPNSGFPSVPGNLTMGVSAPGVRTMTEHLVLRTDGRVRLIIKSVQNPKGPTTMSIYNLAGGHVCTPKQKVTVNGDEVNINPIPAFKVKRIRQPPSVGFDNHQASDSAADPRRGPTSTVWARASTSTSGSAVQPAQGRENWRLTSFMVLDAPAMARGSVPVGGRGARRSSARLVNRR